MSTTATSHKNRLPHTPVHPAPSPSPRATKPSVWSAWKWENRKAAGRWYWLALALLSGVGMVNGAANYLEYRTEFDAQEASWLAVWGQATLLTTMLAFPLLVGSLVAQIAVGEHSGRNWQRMHANRLDSAMLHGKYLHMAQIALLTTLVLVAEFAITGLLLGFDLAGLAPYLLRAFPIALAIFALELCVAWLGVVMNSFASIMTLVLLGTALGSALVLLSPQIAPYFPLSLVTAACSSRDLGNVESVGSILTITAVSAGWVCVWAMALRQAIIRTL